MIASPNCCIPNPPFEETMSYCHKYEIEILDKYRIDLLSDGMVNDFIYYFLFLLIFNMSFIYSR